MTTKKSASKRLPKKRPSKALLKELKAVFEKHNWSGTAIMIQPMEAASVGTNALGATIAGSGLVPDPSMLNCQPPKQPQFLTITHPDGTLESGWACL